MRFRLFAFLTAMLVAVTASAQTAPQDVEAAITTIRMLDRPSRIILATVWDGNKYVQCRIMNDEALVCEAAGTLMQPSMERILIPDRIAKLAAMGWWLDPSFGNYIETFEPQISSGQIAEKILSALSQGYNADLRNLEIKVTSVSSERCPPRNGPSQNLAGIISDAPSMRSVAVHACAYAPDGTGFTYIAGVISSTISRLFLPIDGGPPRQVAAHGTATDLIKLYGSRVTVEIQRLRVNIHYPARVAFGTGQGYIQCETQTEPDGFYCEAESADSWPALATVLTDARISRLHALGYADPGRAPNYSQTYLTKDVKDSDLASDILTILHDVYGYDGWTKLDVVTEEDRR